MDTPPPIASPTHDDPLAFAEPAVRDWFGRVFRAPTDAQAQAWPAIAAGRSTLLLAPTGSGKTLAAFLVALNRLVFSPAPTKEEQGVRVLYLSPLKALGVDVERNLRAPLAGITAAAEGLGTPARRPSIGVRTGDTPQRERARMARKPPDILITTPESLYLLLTSNAAAMLHTVETVIVDEIHTMVATKRGAHLFLSLERLEALRGDRPLQRVGLSATQRPLGEVARLLGGLDSLDGVLRQRPVEVVDAGRTRPTELRVEVPVEDMSDLGRLEEISSGPASSGPRRISIWPAIHPRLVELIRAHRTTLVFANSRRLAERLAGEINEVAEEELALAHHGSIAKDRRKDIEERLKRGELPALVATSSLELGIDMGAIDLVVQIEAPVSVASGIQRVGRSGHSVDATSRAVLFPKHRGDLLACAATTPEMSAGRVESTRHLRNPLDVLAQQVVAIVVRDEGITSEAVFDLVRRAAPFADLARGVFDGVLDMLAGRFASDRFSGLRARVTWDRVTDRLTARRGSRQLAVLSGGTIPDRGLYGVFLAGAEPPVRVGELDEEMVFETRVGDVFALGASSWRVEEVTHDRVLVSPAPGEPGKMPFWHGDRPGRPFEFGEAVGRLTRELATTDEGAARSRLATEHGLDDRAADNLVRYVAEQALATGRVPSDRTVVVERFLDEVGDWCVALLAPFGSPVLTPWAMAVQARLRDELGFEVQTLAADDGVIFRVPESDEPPETAWFVPAADEVRRRVTAEVAGSALFAARFRENAARALLLPRRGPGRRTPLWIQRKKAADLLEVASEHPDFPIVLETYRECLADAFDLDHLEELLRRIESGDVEVRAVDSERPSPFSASLLFAYVANFLYDGDAPLAERRARVLSLDHGRLRELLGEPELRELLDPDVVAEVESGLQRLSETRRIRHVDALHDALQELGPLSADEIEARSTPEAPWREWLGELHAARRAYPVQYVTAAEGAAERWAAVEDLARLRDALGVVPPPGVPEVFLTPVPTALRDVVSRFARTHGPFSADRAAGALGLGSAVVLRALADLAERDRVVEGEFLQGRQGREWCDTDVLRRIKQGSLARLRREIAPVEAETFTRFTLDWHGVTRPSRGLDAVLAAVERLQGVAIPASEWFSSVLPARVDGFHPRDLDELCAAGEIVWRGVSALGDGDGYVAFHLADHYASLAAPAGPVEHPAARDVEEVLRRRGAAFFHDLVTELGGFQPDLVAALWELVWAGRVTNDSPAPLRTLGRRRGGRGRSARRRRGGRVERRAFRSRRADVPPGTEGRWSLLPEIDVAAADRAHALAESLLQRHGIVTREAVRAEGHVGGFGAVYPVLKALEERGRVRRGYFVSGLGAAQFGLPGAPDRLRRCGAADDVEHALVLAATDPANPFGTALPWPTPTGSGRPERAASARVVLDGGRLLAHLSRGRSRLVTFEGGPEPGSAALRRLAQALERLGRPTGLRLQTIDGEPAASGPLADALLRIGFRATSEGLTLRRGGATAGGTDARG